MRRGAANAIDAGAFASGSDGAESARGRDVSIVVGGNALVADPEGALYWPEEGTLVRTLKRAGAIVVGKTRLPEFAFWPGSTSDSSACARGKAAPGGAPPWIANGR